MIAQDMGVVSSYGGDTTIAAVRGPTRWLGRFAFRIIYDRQR